MGREFLIWIMPFTEEKGLVQFGTNLERAHIQFPREVNFTEWTQSIRFDAFSAHHVRFERNNAIADQILMALFHHFKCVLVSNVILFYYLYCNSVLITSGPPGAQSKIGNKNVNTNLN